MKGKLTILFCLCILFASAQNSEMDSLFSVIGNSKPDTNKVNTLNIYSWKCFNTGDYPKALKYTTEAKELAASLEYKKGLAVALDHSGSIYKEQSLYPKALDAHLRSLQIYESLGNKKDIAKTYNNIGLIYQYQLNYEKALDYYFKALKLAEEMGSKQGIAICCNNIGLIYTEQKKYDDALLYSFRSLKIKEELQDKYSLAKIYGNIAVLYMKKAEYKTAMEYILKDLALAKETGNKKSEAVCYSNIGMIKTYEKKYAEAKENTLRSLRIFSEINDRENVRLAYGDLADMYAKMSDYKSAYDFQVRFKKLTDSIFNVENSKQLSDLKTNFEVEKKEVELKAKAEAEKEKLIALSSEEKKRRELIIFAVGGILLLVIIFSAFLYQRFKITRRQKHIIEEQKELVEEKQKEILDSISYAKRLQSAILPPVELIKSVFPKSFVLYLPKDIVAGDFYWMEQEGSLTYIAAADSTGHGVPGAMVSVVCSNALNRSLKEFKLREPGKILEKTRELVIETFEKSGESVKDGMDISLLCVDIVNRRLQWSGANNPLWYMENKKVVEIKADKQPVGKYENLKPFTTHEFTFRENNTYYLITDGYADQFGGEKGKKFKYKALQQLLEANAEQPLEQQRELLLSAFNSWKGNLEQVDDVTIIGLKL